MQTSIKLEEVRDPLRYPSLDEGAEEKLSKRLENRGAVEYG